MLKLYENIKKFRLERKMTQDELAYRAGYNDRSSIAKIESGRVDLSQSKIKQFAEIFGVTPGCLMGWVDEVVSEETDKKNSTIAELTIRMTKDPDFLEVVSMLAELSAEQCDVLKPVIATLGKK